MTEFNHESAILMHLQDLVTQLESKLNYPKNTPKRRENLKQQLDEAQQRLQDLKHHTTGTRQRRFDSARSSDRDRFQSPKQRVNPGNLSVPKQRVNPGNLSVPQNIAVNVL